MRLKSSETLTLKAALKKTIRDATACAEDMDRGADRDDLQIENTPDVSYAITICTELEIYAALRSGEAPFHIHASFDWAGHIH